MARNTVKTLPFFTKLDADVADATVTNLDAVTVYAKDASRSFKSVLVWIAFEDIVTVTGGTIGEFRVGASVDGSAYTTITEAEPIVHSSENIGGVLGPFDFTALFNASFPAADSAALDIQVYFDQTTGTTLGMRNVSAKVEITYQFDGDASGTHYDYIAVPLESLVGAHATTEAEIGTNQIPQLTGAGGIFENVTSFAVIQQTFVVDGNDASGSGATDYALNLRIDSGTTKTFPTTEKALGTQNFKRRIYFEAPTASAVHAFKAWTTGAASLNHAAYAMYVVYSYEAGGSKSVQSLQIPFTMDLPIYGTGTGDNHRIKLRIPIPEPGTLELLQSGVELHYVFDTTMAGFNLRMGSGTYRAYTDAGTAVAGSIALMQRIDSGSASGLGVTFPAAAGYLDVTIDYYQTNGPTSTDNIPLSVSGILHLNYRSDVAAAGRNSHSRTTRWLMQGFDNAALNFYRLTTPVEPVIPEANYYLSGVAYDLCIWTLGVVRDLSVGVENDNGIGWVDVGGLTQRKQNEIGCSLDFIDAGSVYGQFTQDGRSLRLNIETERRLAVGYPQNNTAAAIGIGVGMYLTYHSIEYNVTGAITNVDPNISVFGVLPTVDTLRLEKLIDTGDFSYTIHWYMPESIWIVAVDTSNERIVSTTGGSSGVDIDMAPAAGGGMLVHPGMGGGMRG